ncbi:type VII secretion protein EccCb [Nocardioides acrostichi]|uniref:Type VII secretion protein EccCb n=1 Tax=Nocardioides acrostichi TaxID=2784339 RepID=A0A930V0N7_9ACTN|nr:type VII secretion protein EccCb [Nocardioides acrostichi]MBF4163541.1 type VII secretion protein EccCb [Nocardioides acrostichi]
MTRPATAPRADPLVLPAVPDLAPAEGAGGLVANALPMLGSMGSIALVASSAGSGGDPTRSYLAAGMFLLATLGFVVVQIDRQRSRRAAGISEARAGYQAELDDARHRVRAAAGTQREEALRRCPAPSALPTALTGGWPARGEHRARIGTHAEPLHLPLVAPPPRHSTDPALADAGARLVQAHRLVPDLPFALDLTGVRSLQVAGPPAAVRDLMRALVCSAAAECTPQQLAVGLLGTVETVPAWGWLTWLPHAHSATSADDAGPVRLVAATDDDRGLAPLADLLADEGPPALLVVDGAATSGLTAHLPDRVAVLEASAASRPLTGPDQVRITLDGTLGRVERLRTEPVEFAPDTCPTTVAEAVARRLLARYDDDAPASTGPTVDVLAQLNLASPAALDPAAAWRHREGADRLRVPLGVDDSGAAVHLDLKESAQGGMGPHGLVVGATGSGKSELLRTLVLGLAATHSPEQLSLVLVDFKGGATFAGLGDLPHCSAVITNLADELDLVERMDDALTGELVRRQELLRAAGHLSSVTEYEQRRLGGADLEPLPALLLVVDEFAELLTVRPAMVETFNAIGRLGRSLGLHLLLASQRLEEGRLRGLESHLSYRIGLRTFGAADSRAVLGVPDAHELPAVPGLGYLRADPTTLVRFTSAYVSGPVRTPEGTSAPPPGRTTLTPFTLTREGSHIVTRGVENPRPKGRSGAAPSLLETAVARMRGHGRPAHRIWLPPLQRSPALADLLAPVSTPDRGLHTPTSPDDALVVPIGVVDRPREQRRDTLTVDLRGANGHLAVVGGPRSGVSTALRTVLTGLALTHTPQRLRCYVLDLGGDLGGLAHLPHVSGVATRSEPDVARRVVAEVTALLERRERGADPRSDRVVVVVDGWGVLRTELTDLEEPLTDLAARGLRCGVHVLIGARRWADLRPQTRDLVGSTVELRLGDPLTSECDRRSAEKVPADAPGRGITHEGHHLLIARPSAPDGSDLAEAVAASWPGEPAPPLRLLPARVSLAEVRAQTPRSRGLLLGVDEQHLAPVELDPDRDGHLLVLGDSGAGKTNLLRTLAHEVARTRPDSARLVVIDPRRTLLGDLPQTQVLHHLSTAQRASAALTDLAGYLEARLPGPEVTPVELKRRSWWRGAEVYVLVDDHDLVAAGAHAPSPLAPLVPLLAHGRDVGLHVVVARRSAGAARALHDPLLQTVRDLGSPTLLLSGDPQEGPLAGAVRAERMPPGRARLVTRDGSGVVQLAWTDQPSEDEAPQVSATFADGQSARSSVSS